MLSRLVSRAVLNSRLSPTVVCQRYYADESEETMVVKKETIVEIADTNDPSKVVASEVDDLVPQPTPFYGPLRDHVNFPRIQMRDKPVPSRLGMVPESWFKYMYPKMGVTGPYTLGIGIMLFLVNKEIYLIDDAEFKHTVAFFAWIYVITKSPIGSMLQELVWGFTENEEKAMGNLQKYGVELRKEAIAHEKEEQWRLEGKKLLFAAKKENVGLQLEASYRKSFMDVYNQLKRNLDYQVEVSRIDQRIKQQFMIKWVLERVNESLNQTSEKENLKQCIANLNALAAKV